MPFPNEHAARQTSPTRFIRFRRQNNKGGAGVDFIFGITSDGSVVLQSIRFSSSRFTVDQAKSWLKDHKFKTSVEKATGGAREADLRDECYSFVLEAVPGTDRLRVVLVREGLSKNGNNWTKQAIAAVVRCAEGTPVCAYDASPRGDKSWFSHWEFWRQKLPPEFRRNLPERMEQATFGRIVNAKVETGTDGLDRAVGEVELRPEGGWLRSLARRAASIARKIGLSIHVPEDGLTGNLLPGGGIEPTDLTRIVSFDVVDNPSAGGGFIPALEAALTEGRSMKLWQRLLRLVAGDEAKKTLTEQHKATKLPEDATAETLCEKHLDLVKALVEAMELKWKPDDETDWPGFLTSIAEAIHDPKDDDKDKDKKKKKKKVVEGPKFVVVRVNDDGGGDRVQLTKEQLDAVLEQNKTERDTLATIVKSQAITLLEAAVDKTGLPKTFKEFATKHLKGIVEAQGTIEPKAVDTYLTDLSKTIGARQAPGGGLLEQPGGGDVAITSFGRYSKLEEFVVAFDALLEGNPTPTIGEGKEAQRVPALRGIKEAYGILTGDVHCEGRVFYRDARNRNRGIATEKMLEANPFVQDFLGLGKSMLEAMTTTTFPLILSDRMHRRMVKEYMQQDLNWKLIGAPETVTDFKAWRIEKLGEYGLLPTVAEAGAYTDLQAGGGVGQPTEDIEVSLQVVKRGRISKVTWEMIKNDDLRSLQKIPTKLARAAARTLNYFVWDLLLNNSVIYDTTALATAGHTNLTAAALSWTNLKLFRKRMGQQKDIDSREAGRVRMVKVACGPDNIDQLTELLKSSTQPELSLTHAGTVDRVAAAAQPRADTETSDNRARPNVLGEVGPVLVHRFDDIDADQYWGLADPIQAEMVAVGFLDGQQNPSLFVQDLANVGSFFDTEEITHKVRHVYDAEVVDFRGFQGGIP